MNLQSVKFAAAIASSAIALCLVQAADSASEREAVGYVFDSVGDWVQDGVKFSHRSGDPVYAGAIITLDPSYKDTQTRGAAIIINLFNGKREERSSEQLAMFGKPIQLPSSLRNQSSALSRFLRAMGAVFAKEPEKYLITTVRGIDELPLHDAVMELTNEKVDVRQVFAAAPAGKYLGRLTRIDRAEANTNVADQSFAFVWRPGANEGLAVPNLSPGLWRLDLLERNGERLYGTDAWLLVQQPPNYQRAVRLFDDVLAVTRKWGSNASDNEVRSFARTALDALAHEHVE